MEIYINQIIGYLGHVLLASFNLLVVLFGPFLILMLLLNFSANITARLSVRFWGRNIFLFGFGWLGCSVHELSHAFFALIFGHKINEITLFEPNKDGESLGHVSHSYNKKSIYQKIGNFFIGISPLLAGGIVLYLITYILYRVDISQIFSYHLSVKVFGNMLLFKQFCTVIWTSLVSYKNLLFSGNVVVWWKSILMIYVLYSTGSSMTLSKSDVKGAISGFLWLVIFIVLFNLLTLWYNDFGTRILANVVIYISAFYFLLILSFLTNILFIILLFVLNQLKNLFI